MTSLDGRVVAVAGAGGGLGPAVVGALAAHGARVAACERSEDHLARVPDTAADARVADLSTPDGAVRWSHPARPEHPALGTAAPAVARGTAIVPAGDALAALDVQTGEIVGAIPGAAPSRLAVDASLGIAAMDADGLAAGWRLATHLSVV
jgi:NAD(P)-dependent dehydrogenase (short-subunit alcohol dehydrogenase family)